MTDIEVSETVKGLLDPDEILGWEFKYARDTSLQANTDRTQVVNLYLLLVGGVSSVLVALPAVGQGVLIPRWGYAVVLGMLGVLGLFAVLKLIWLRRAWHDSVLTMNRIKDFYLAHYPELAPAFRWRTTSIPAPGKAGTITFDLVVMVSVVGSLALGGAGLLLPLQPWAAAALGGGYCLLLLGLYFHLLRG